MNKANLDSLIARGYDFDIEQSFRKGWSMFTQKAIFSIGYTMFILSIQFLFGVYFKDYIPVFSIFLAGPLYAGFFLVANKISRGEQVIYPDFFGGFSYYIPVLLVWVVGQVLVVLGIFLLVLPGIYLAVSYAFAVIMAIFVGLDFWNALDYSRKLIHQKWWKFLVLLLIIFALNVVGALFFIVGLLVTIPLSHYTLYVIFEEITQDVLED